MGDYNRKFWNPFVEKNVQNLLSAAYILKFGISDIAEIDAI
jgi:hypothetical protein